MAVDENSLKAYIVDAAAHFKSPADVLRHSELGTDEKRKILESWKVDEQELSTATEENMGTEDSQILSQVVEALRSLDA